jgi:predicted Ser/Thr protein kinase
MPTFTVHFKTESKEFDKIANVFDHVKTLWKKTDKKQHDEPFVIETSVDDEIADFVCTLKDFGRFYAHFRYVGPPETKRTVVKAKIHLYDSDLWKTNPARGFSNTVVDQLAYIFNVKPSKCNINQRIRDPQKIAGSTQGDVFKSKLSDKKGSFAVKYMDPDSHAFGREALASKVLGDNEFTSKIIAVCSEGIIASEWIEGETLKDYRTRHKKEKITFWHAASFINQFAKIVHFLHSKKIAHKDLHEKNIIIDVNEKIKVIDFGKSCGQICKTETSCTGVKCTEADFAADCSRVVEFINQMIAITQWEKNPDFEDDLVYLRDNINKALDKERVALAKSLEDIIKFTEYYS